MAGSAAGYPTGTVTFLFTDIEGSTDLWERYPGDMPAVLARHDELVRGTLEAYRGTIFKTVGDGFYAVFGDARAALAAALAAQRATYAEPWPIPDPVRVRMALHSGAAEIRDGDYFGTSLNRVARILAAGHGGQILLSQAVERLVSDGFPDGAALRDLGERTLRDLTRSERIFQLVTEDLPVDFPPLRTLDARRHNLPAQVSPLIGRGRELGAIRTLFLRDGARLVTLTGPGGIGKTRIALQLGADLLDAFRDGVFFINLTSVRGPERVPLALLQALGGKAEGAAAPAAALAALLRDQQCLLLLDNFEQVLAAAPLVGEFLGAAPGLTILVTSQSALRIRGEHEVVIHPLALPPERGSEDPARLMASEAVALFVQRAREVLPTFELTRANAAAVVAICRQLDGLPLAIELAAARIKLFPPAALLARLEHRFEFLTSGQRDAPDRHRTLRKAIRWSYDLLDAGDQALFRRLAAFDGGFTLAAAEAVCTTPAEGLDVVEGLTSLVDKSLLRQTESTGDEPRFERLRTVWQFAVELLAEDPEAPVWRRRQAEFFGDFAQQFNPNRPAPPLQAPAQLARLEVERFNIRVAMEWALQAGDGRLAARLCAALPALWFLRGVTEEGRDWPERALLLLDPVTGPERADALNLFGRTLQMRGENSPRVRAWFEESLAIYRHGGDAAGTARALMNLGNVDRRA
ncbi:MAG: adenylate/guanylate cyclase domain-containing protein, partial [Gemmatimonadota bacterium]